MGTAWQPLTWIIFHILTLNYNDNYKEHYISFFESFKVIIPCSICRNHYNSNINKSDMSIENNINSEKIFNWTINLHNNVNKTNHKKLWNYDEAKNHYTKFNFNGKILKFFIYQYIMTNFKKNPDKTFNLRLLFCKFSSLKISKIHELSFFNIIFGEFSVQVANFEPKYL